MTEKSKTENIRNVIELSDRQHSGKWRKWLWIIGAMIVIISFSGFFWLKPGSSALPQFKTEEVRRGLLKVTVTATGALEPLNQVDVGTEVSGTLKSVAVDFNDKVEVGQILATLDTTRLEAEARQSEASLEVAKAKLIQAQANLSEARSHLDRLKKVWKMSGGQTPSEYDLDTAEASVKRYKAEETAAKAQINEAKAVLFSDKNDLEKAVIKSPINGIVLDRAVEQGQTVAASLQAPVLFTLAEDLTQMKLSVDVDEADVGMIREGQKAVFRVDAYSDREFSAQITQVRYAAQTENNVVTYETILSVDNSDMLLRPGMTATAEIIVQHIEDALLVPNMAFRFKPQTENTSDSSDNRGFLSKIIPRGPRTNRKQKSNDSDTQQQPCVWILKNGKPEAVPVASGASDGIKTEVKEGELKPGDQVIISTLVLKS